MIQNPKIYYFVSRLRRQRGTCAASSSVQCDNCYLLSKYGLPATPQLCCLPLASLPPGWGPCSECPLRSIDCQGRGSSCRHFGQNIKISGNALSLSGTRHPSGAHCCTNNGMSQSGTNVRTIPGP